MSNKQIQLYTITAIAIIIGLITGYLVTGAGNGKGDEELQTQLTQAKNTGKAPTYNLEPTIEKHTGPHKPNTRQTTAAQATTQENTTLFTEEQRNPQRIAKVGGSDHTHTSTVSGEATRTKDTQHQTTFKGTKGSATDTTNTDTPIGPLQHPVKQVYSEKTSKINELGRPGSDLKISTREENSGTREAFSEYTGIKDIAAEAGVKPRDGEPHAYNTSV